jgi:hypothetical protein
MSEHDLAERVRIEPTVSLWDSSFRDHWSQNQVIVKLLMKARKALMGKESNVFG